jgi:peptidoglycan-associated lipoprotein
MTFCRATQEQQEGWFSSNRQQGKGYDNIYSFLLPSIKINITGYVMDTEGEPIPEAIVRVVGRNGMNFKSLTKPDGSYIASIDRSTEYVMMAGKTGYLNRRAQFTSDPAEEDADYEVDFYLPTISNPVLIDNIFYDYNKATLREESYPALDDLVQLLNDNPYCAIELAAHTDRVGGQPFNLDLSQRRAQSVVDYLIEQGIDEDRLTPIGYGKSVPKVIDDKLHAKYDFLPEGQELTEDFVNTLPPDQRSIADQINRRTEFQVLSTTWGLE